MENETLSHGNAIQDSRTFRAIIDTIYEGYYEIDLDGAFSFVNKVVCEILGYDESELLATNIRTYMDDENDRELLKAYNRIIHTETPMDGIEFDIKHKDGQIRRVESSVSPIYSEDEKILGYRGIIRDITEKKLLEQEKELRKKRDHNAWETTIISLVKLSEYRDTDAGSHVERIREFAKMLAQELSIHKKFKDLVTDAYIEDIFQASILHDIGKAGIPDSVLLKPGKLTIEEFEIIKEHSRMGGDAIREIKAKSKGPSFLTQAMDIAYYHHERWDGKGYPKGLIGEDIPLSARIVALSDVYDALTSKRIYKEAFTHDQAIKIIVSERGKQFDPDIVDAFMARNKDFVKVRQELDDRDEELKISMPEPSFI